MVHGMGGTEADWQTWVDVLTHLRPATCVESHVEQPSWALNQRFIVERKLSSADLLP